MGIQDARTKFRKWRHALRRREISAYQAYERVTSYPMFLLAVLFLISFVITLDPNPSSWDQKFARTVIPIAWVAFAADYAIGVLFSPNRWKFVRTHLLLLVALIFPPLRILLLGHVFQTLRKAPLKTGERARMYLLYATTLLLVFSAIAVVFFERQNPNGNITTFGDGLWWGGETVSTVGYGDYYPVTFGGRIVAGILFINGVALLSVITAGLAQRFTTSDAPAQQNDDVISETVTDVEQTVSAGATQVVHSETVAELHKRIAGLEGQLSTLSDKMDSLLQAAHTPAPASEEDSSPDTPSS